MEGVWGNHRGRRDVDRQKSNDYIPIVAALLTPSAPFPPVGVH